MNRSNEENINWLFPARAGVIPKKPRRFLPGASFPRTRGGDPNNPLYADDTIAFSLHTRG